MSHHHRWNLMVIQLLRHFVAKVKQRFSVRSVINMPEDTIQAASVTG
jgi:hypothetical protein